MKRALPGKKRKQATPARQPVARRSSPRGKVKLAKPAAKKSAPVQQTKTAVKPKLPRRKAVPPKAAKAKRPRVIAPKNSKRAATRNQGIATVDRGGRAGLVVPAPAPGARTKATRKTARNAEFTLPAFLLEGDVPSHPASSGPGEKYSLGPNPPLDHFAEAKAALPEAYGTGRLFLTPRDPHWLYAHWDFTMQEQFRHNARSVDRHMVLRLHDADQPGPHISEVHVHPESRHWFIHVDQAGLKYFAEIGYYQGGHKWKSLALSGSQRTPPDNISADSTVELATIPLELSFETMLALLKEHSAVGPELPLARGLEQIRSRMGQPFAEAAPAPDWSPEQEQALAGLLAANQLAVGRPSSEEFTIAKASPESAAEFVFESGEAAPAKSLAAYVSSCLGGAGW